MGFIITTAVGSISIDFNGESSDRKFAKIRSSTIRSIVKDADDKCIELVFDSGAIQYMNYEKVDSIDGVSITSQDILYDKLEPIIFA